MQFQHPYLTLGQIHSALACYRDHAPALDWGIERRLQRVEERRRAATIPPLAVRLKGLASRSHP
jgi:hypothetical protein